MRMVSPGSRHDAVAEDGDHLLPVAPHHDLGFRAGRLDDDDLDGQALRREPEMLRPDAVDGRPSGRGGERGAERQAQPAVRHEAVRFDAAPDEVHGRRADEAGDEQVVGTVVEVERGADLLDDAVMHDDDLVGHGHGLDLVVRHVDGGRLQALVQLLDLGAHGDAQFGVEVGQGLVEQEDLRVAHDGAAHGDALALAAGELARIAVEQLREAEDLGGALHALVDLGPRRPPQLHGEGHVVGDRHVRVERVVLEHHGDVALFRGDVVDDALADADLPRRDVLESRDHAQQGRFPAAGRADQDDELAVPDVDRHAVDNRRRPEGLADVPDLDARHVSFRPRPHRLACVSSRRPIGGSLRASSAEPRARSSRIFHCYAVILGRSRRRRPEDLRTVRRVRVMRSSGLASLARG